MRPTLKKLTESTLVRAGLKAAGVLLPLMTESFLSPRTRRPAAAPGLRPLLVRLATALDLFLGAGDLIWLRVSVMDEGTPSVVVAPLARFDSLYGVALVEAAPAFLFWLLAGVAVP